MEELSFKDIGQAFSLGIAFYRQEQNTALGYELLFRVRKVKRGPTAGESGKNSAIRQ